jgi:hypothetical protein
MHCRFIVKSWLNRWADVFTTKTFFSVSFCLGGEEEFGSK